MNIEDINELRNIFQARPNHGEKLPNVKDVADFTSFYLKSGTTHIEHIMFNNAWHKKVIVSGNVTLQKV